MGKIKGFDSPMEKIVAVGFVACAFVAVFVGMHKEDIENGQFGDVVASYVES